MEQLLPTAVVPQINTDTDSVTSACTEVLPYTMIYRTRMSYEDQKAYIRVRALREKTGWHMLASTIDNKNLNNHYI